MSNISNRHTFIPYISGETKPLAEQVGLRIIFKGRNGKEAEHKSQFVSVPAVSDDEITQNLSALLPMVRTMIQGYREDCARAAFLAGSKEVTSEQVSLIAAISHAEEVSKGSRLTGDDVKAWFAENLEDSLTVEFAKRLGLSDSPSEAQMKKLEQSLNLFREGFASLASGKTKFEPKKAEVFRNLLNLSESAVESAIGSRFDVRLNHMISGESEDLMSALGF
jgi:hypothetical protein